MLGPHGELLWLRLGGLALLGLVARHPGDARAILGRLLGPLVRPLAPG